MTDYTKLVEALRYCAESGDFNCNKDCPMYPNYPKCLTKMDMDAAAAIVDLQATIELMKLNMPDFFPDANKVTLPKMEVQE